MKGESRRRGEMQGGRSPATSWPWPPVVGDRADPAATGTDPTQRGREAAGGASPVEPAARRSGGGLLGRWAGGCGGSPRIRLRCSPERDEGAPDRLTGGGCGGCGSPTKTRKHAAGRRPLGRSIRRERVGAAGGSGRRSGEVRLGLGPATRFCSGSSPQEPSESDGLGEPATKMGLGRLWVQPGWSWAARTSRPKSHWAFFSLYISYASIFNLGVQVFRLKEMMLFNNVWF